MHTRIPDQIAEDLRVFAKAPFHDYGFCVARVCFAECQTGRQVDFVLDPEDDAHDVLSYLTEQHMDLHIGRESGEDGSWDTLELSGRLVYVLDFSDSEEPPALGDKIPFSIDRSDIVTWGRVTAVETVNTHRLATIEVEGRLENDPIPRRRNARGFWESEVQS